MKEALGRHFAIESDWSLIIPFPVCLVPFSSDEGT